MSLAITDWPANERPRERLLQYGPQALSDAELLAIFLRTGVTGYSAVDLARHLLSEFGNLRSLLLAEQRSFCEHRGLGLAKYAQLQAILEMAQRHLACGFERGETLKNPAMTREYLSKRLRDRPHEVFACLFLDSQHRVLAFEELFRGSIAGASVYPREVVKAALGHNAAALIFAHNHPSGVAEPSQSDRDLTRQLIEALGLVDIRVLDHCVIGDREVISFAERGWV